MDALVTVVLVIVIALVFDFTNGFHDTANAMATSVATGALTPRVAVLISAVLNLVGAFLSTEVAKTIASGIIEDGRNGLGITPTLIFAGLVAAVLWNLLTWYFGLPSSSTHALFGGLIGAAIIGGGFDTVNWATLVSSVVLPAVFSPFVAGLIAVVATFAAYKITKQAMVRGSQTGFRHAQTVSASLVSLAHGTNDAQKTMGVVTLALIAGHVLDAKAGVPWWVVLMCGLAIAIGTYTGGWRIIRTVGKRITDVQPAQGFAAETSAAATILASSALGFPLSTTQVTSGSVIGAGVGRRLASVHWNVVGRIATGWIFTLPAAAVVGALAAALAGWNIAGLVIVAVLGAAGMVGLFLLARRTPVTRENVNDVDEHDRGADAADAAGGAETAAAGRGAA